MFDVDNILSYMEENNLNNWDKIYRRYFPTPDISQKLYKRYNKSSYTNFGAISKPEKFFNYWVFYELLDVADNEICYRNSHGIDADAWETIKKKVGPIDISDNDKDRFKQSLNNY